MFVRCSIYFSAGYYAWTESYWYSTSVSALTSVAPDAATLVNLRVAMLGSGAQVDKVRLTNDNNQRQAIWLATGQFNTTPPAVTAQTGLTNSDEPYSSIVLRCQDVNGFAKLIYLSGYPDGVVGIGFPTPPTTGIGPAWYSAYRAFTKELSLRWSWRRKQTPLGGLPVTPVYKLVVNGVPPSDIGIVALGTAPTFNIGDDIQLTGFSRVQQKNVPQLNGKWVITDKDTTLIAGSVVYYLRGSSGIDVTQITRMGKATPIVYVFSNIFTVSIDSVTHRKRGVRSGRPLGRLKTR